MMKQEETQPETTTMYRPVGPAELELVAASGFHRWPPRLPEQPIFYPVTNEQYAREINVWNLTQFGAGAVTRFEVLSSYADPLEIHCVGAPHATEWWIPAEDVDTFNENIVGLIEVVEEVEGSA